MVRFGYGAIAFCDEGHRFKWCNYLYCFIPSDEWHVHTAWCPKSQPNCSVAAYTRKEQQEPSSSSKHRSSCNVSDTEGGAMDTTDAEDCNMEYDSLTEGSDVDLPLEIRNVLTANRENIIRGDHFSTQNHWTQVLREHRSRTMVTEIFSNASQSRCEVTQAGVVHSRPALLNLKFYQQRPACRSWSNSPRACGQGRRCCGCFGLPRGPQALTPPLPCIEETSDYSPLKNGRLLLSDWRYSLSPCLSSLLVRHCHANVIETTRQL